MNGGLEDVNDEQSVCEFGGGGVFRQKFTDNVFPGIRDFFLTQALFEAELVEELLEGFANGTRGVADARRTGSRRTRRRRVPTGAAESRGAGEVAVAKARQTGHTV